MLNHDFVDAPLPESGSHVLVGMSGGVDSSLTMLLLKQRGCVVTGVTMRTWNPLDGIIDAQVSSSLISDGIEHSILTRNSCYGPDEDIDISQCIELCKEYDVPYLTVTVSDAYKRYVLDYFRNEYTAGRTPNPCVCCNQFVKFGAMLDATRAAGVDFDYFCTGHYARVVTSSDYPEKFFVAMGRDITKDQSYFLNRVSSDVLAHVRFPLGTMLKSDAKLIAKKLQLKALMRPESQDFIPQEEWHSIFKDEKIEPGDIVDSSGKVVGKHKGIIYYTVGQRRGLGVSSSEPLYVQAIDRINNRVVVAKNSELDCLGLEADSCVWTAGKSPAASFKTMVKIRLATPAVPATVVTFDNGSVRVIFDKSMRAVAPGQSVVFYDNNVIIGGGFITRSIHE